MDRSSVIYLVSETYEKNQYGVLIPTVTKRKVFANVTSVTATEWFEGGRNGLNPELRMRVFAPEYHGEEVVQFNGKYYAIYRTYMARDDVLDLYVERTKGEAEQYAAGNQG